jgi:hypothetical protein
MVDLGMIGMRPGRCAAVFALLALLACEGKDIWPAASAEDRAGGVYVVALAAENGARVLRVNADGRAEDLKITCERSSAVALTPGGDALLYGLNSALHRRDLRTAQDRVVARFPFGEAREGRIDDKGEMKVYGWRCGYRFRDICFGPKGEIAFLLESDELALPDKKPADFTNEEKAAFKPRTAFAADAGLYLLTPSDDRPAFLGPARALYGFQGDTSLVIENKFTIARYDRRNGSVTRLLFKGAHEMGFLPAAAVTADKVVAVGAKAKKGSTIRIVEGVYVLAKGRGAGKPVQTFEAKMPATRAMLSADGRYLAVELAPRGLGEPAIHVVDLESRRSKLLVTGGRLLDFAPGSRAIFYVAGAGYGGDIYFAGLDGGSRRLTTTGDYLPPP